jgi:hypothetical protein
LLLNEKSVLGAPVKPIKYAGWLRLVAIVIVGFLPLTIAFILVIDPYGVSPLGLSWPRINAIKLRRMDIDRALKPYEVWRDQPRTVFLGSSISGHSIDPAVLDGTRFAPAYNAAIPNGSIKSSLDYLEEYIGLNPRLRIAIVEVHLSDFIFVRNFVSEKQTRGQFIANSVALFASRLALSSAIETLEYNAKRQPPVHEIKPGGYVFRPPGGETKSGFDAFPAFIWGTFDPMSVIVNEESLDLARRIVEVAHDHGIELIFIALPNHAYFDYWHDSIHAWSAIGAVLTKIAELGRLASFSQPNPIVYESVSAAMTYWIDSLHPSLRMGREMQRALADLPTDNLPSNFAAWLRPQDIAAHVESRRQAVRKWAKGNPDFVAQFDAARQQWLARTGQQ